MSSRSAPFFTDFSLGEVSPKIKGRFDLENYAKSMETCENFVPIPYGGIEFRRGTKYIAEVKSSANATRLIPFVQASIEHPEIPGLFTTFFLEAGNLYIRPWHYNETRVTIPAPMGVPVPYEFVSPFATSELNRIDYDVWGNTIYLIHEKHFPRRLTFDPSNYISPGGLWGMEFEQIDLDGPYNDKNTTATTIDPDVTTGHVQLISSTPIFTTADIDRCYRLHDGYVKITQYISSTEVHGTVMETLTANTPTVDWWKGIFCSNYGPAAVCVHEQRLILARGNTIWGSAPGDFTDFVTGTTAGDPFQFTVVINGDISWLESTRCLVFGTTQSIARASGYNESLSPVSVDIKKQVDLGTARIKPARTDNEVMFVQYGLSRIRRLNYNQDTDIYKAENLTFLAEHMADSTKYFTEVAFEDEPSRVLWAVRSDGQLVGMTYFQELNVVGFCRVVTDGLFESIASVYDPSKRTAAVIVIVNRAGVRSIEKFDTSYFLDSVSLYSGVATTTPGGFTRLEGKTVGVVNVTTGEYLGQFVVSGGIVTLPEPVTLAYVGLPYTGTAKTMPFPSNFMVNKRFAEIGVRVQASQGLNINDQDIDFIEGGSPMDAAPPVFSGVKTVHNLGWDHDAQITLKQTVPFALTVLSINGRMMTGD